MQHITKYKDTPFQLSSTIFFHAEKQKKSIQEGVTNFNQRLLLIISYFYPRTRVSVSCRPGLVTRILEEI